ncbi:MAG: leucine-rich repeat domain-containing protein, partial [Candidatus Nanopelagicales bacterium]
MRTAILSIVDHVGQPDTHHPSTLAELQAVLDGTTNLVLTCDVLSPPDLAEDATVVDIRTLVRRSRIADQLIAVDELLMLVSESLANFESLTSWGIVWQENPLAALGRRRLGLRALTIISGGLGGGGAQAIAERLPATLTTLNLGGNEIGEGGARAIAERLPTTLTTLNLQGNWIGEGGA